MTFILATHRVDLLSLYPYVYSEGPRAMNVIRRRLLSGLGCLVVVAVAFSLPVRADDGLTIFAAASLTNVMEQISSDYTARTGVPVRCSFAASSALARQIEAGTRADVFLSADLEWMDYLEQRKLVRPETRRNLLGNDLVLVAPADSKVNLTIAKGFPLVAALGDGRLATGDPDLVPVGRYAQAALTQLGLWKDVESRLVRAENVRAALAYVARGEAPLGIVYRTDALVESKVRVVDAFPADSHPPIVYPVALTAVADAKAADFLAYLSQPAATERFRSAGFKVPIP